MANRPLAILGNHLVRSLRDQQDRHAAGVECPNRVAGCESGRGDERPARLDRPGQLIRNRTLICTQNDRPHGEWVFCIDYDRATDAVIQHRRMHRHRLRHRHAGFSSGWQLDRSLDLDEGRCLHLRVDLHTRNRIDPFDDQLILDLAVEIVGTGLEEVDTGEGEATRQLVQWLSIFDGHGGHPDDRPIRGIRRWLWRVRRRPASRDREVETCQPGSDVWVVGPKRLVAGREGHPDGSHRRVEGQRRPGRGAIVEAANRRRWRARRQ